MRVSGARVGVLQPRPASTLTLGFARVARVLATAMNTSQPVQESGIRDHVFEELLSAFHRAEDRLETYLAQTSTSPDASVRRVLVQQQQQVVWNHYRALCEHVRSRREGLQEL